MAIALCTPDTPPTPTPPVDVVHLTLRPLILSGRAPPRRDRTLPPRLDATLRGLPTVLGEAPREESGEVEKTEMEWLEMCDGAGEEG